SAVHVALVLILQAIAARRRDADRIRAGTGDAVAVLETGLGLAARLAITTAVDVRLRAVLLAVAAAGARDCHTHGGLPLRPGVRAVLALAIGVFLTLSTLAARRTVATTVDVRLSAVVEFAILAMRWLATLVGANPQFAILVEQARAPL